MKVKRILAMLCTVMVAVTAFSGCGTKKEVDAGKISLKYWGALPGKLKTIVSHYGETDIYKEIEKKTGIHIEFIHPTGNATEQFNVMIASRDLPDIMEYDWSSYVGGDAKACEDGILVDLTEYMEECAPNMLNFIATNAPKAEKWVTTNGKYYTIPSLAESDTYNNLVGTIIRQDLLDKFGLEMPTTIDEWENVLRTFKKGGIKYPLCIMNNSLTYYFQFMSAYGVTRSYVQEDGIVKYGYATEEMKSFLTRFNSWIKEGLVDPDIMTIDVSNLEGKILTGQVGAWINNLTEIRLKEQAIKEVVPEAKLVGAPYPSLKKGEKNKVYFHNRINGYTYQNMVGITTKNKHVKESLKWLDYAYSDEGHILYNFGVEGKTYTLEDGIPKFTELITNNPDGLSMQEALYFYTRADAAGYVDDDYMAQVYDMPAQQEALRMWSKEASQLEPASIWRACIKFNSKEAKRLAEIQPQFQNYAHEEAAKFMVGLRPMSEYDDFIKELKRMGADEAVEIWQTAYDRIK